ncbi:PREDICTED: G-protein coupled receptor Mth2-like isoform X2 [Vollenhovia emeryi]|uniref:G-protein coupled receptor Mth2-like isoform X2 n=1 Tax=Vollenhovia emeryi TaxID=411798 RepID=UPI0005F555A0|nr:PREDICTED: G-protein coupled receptor Mth2-like isoform X2 [Vollenhovia emeryi]
MMNAAITLDSIIISRSFALDIFTEKNAQRETELMSNLMMFPPIVLWCLVLVASTSESRTNSTIGDERSDNSTVRYNPLVNSTKNEIEPTRWCNSCEDSIEDDYEMRYKPRVNSTRNDHETRGYVGRNRERNNPVSTEPNENSTEVGDLVFQQMNENLTGTEGESESTSHELYENSNNDDYNNTTATIVPYEECDDVTCIQLCCPFGDSLTVQGKCVAGQDNYSFPGVTLEDANNSVGKRLNELFRLTVRDPCVEQEFGRYLLHPSGYRFLVNGSLYQGPGNALISPRSYCIAILLRNIYDVIVCTSKTRFPIYVSVCLLISLPFLLLTFVVYSILPELRNMHGYTLRAHVASLFVTYAIMYFGQQTSALAAWKYCVPLAYIFNFSFLSSFFWLNVTCFDIWWTFRGCRSYQTSVKQDKKKYVMYSLYAWGITFIINVICAIMDYAPGIPKSWIRPQMCRIKFWFSENNARTIYFYVPMGATVVANICFFVVTTLTILYQNKRTAHQLRDSESKRHNENKQRFNMYLKLFIVMGITWVMELLAWSINSDFVPEKIKKLLLKRFGGRSCGPFCKIPMNSDTSTNTTSVSGSGSGTLSMQEISSAY